MRWWKFIQIFQNIYLRFVCSCIFNRTVLKRGKKALGTDKVDWMKNVSPKTTLSPCSNVFKQMTIMKHSRLFFNFFFQPLRWALHFKPKQENILDEANKCYTCLKGAWIDTKAKTLALRAYGSTDNDTQGWPAVVNNERMHVAATVSSLRVRLARRWRYYSTVSVLRTCLKCT